jgi:hypothetical protein
VKAFQNRQDCHWQAFKSAGRYAACFSKENCSSATYLPDFKTIEIAPCRFSKALGPTPRQLLSNSNKGFEPAGFTRLSANSKAFGAKRSELINSV